MKAITITVACPDAMIADANQLARVLGYGPDDDQTYGEPLWQDADGNRYAVSSGLVSEAFPAAAAAPLAAPEWGADMTAAARAQAAIAIGETAAPDRLAVIISDDPQAALVALGVVRVEVEA